MAAAAAAAAVVVPFRGRGGEGDQFMKAHHQRDQHLTKGRGGLKYNGEL